MAEQTPLHGVTAKAGAVFTEDAGWQVPARFDDAAAEYNRVRAGAGLFDVSHRGKIELTGPEAAFFLHNLCTNDVNDLPVGAGREAFLTTNKARIVSHLYLYHLLLHDGRPALWLDVPPGTTESLLKYLDRYVISEQVEFADRTREFAQMHLAGPHAHDVLEKALLDDVPPLEDLQHMMRTFGVSDTCHIRRHDLLGVPGYDIVCLAARAANVWHMLTRAGALPAGREAYEILRVEAGTPALGADLDETTFAPEVGRTKQAISYNKGCYLGQEPIVMARDRGQVNRTLLGVKLPDGLVPHNSLLYHDGKEVGRVTSSLVSPRLGAIGLAYVRRGSQETETKLEVEAEGTRHTAVVVALPMAGLTQRLEDRRM
jgi:folate-binding protein YgfZ